VETFDSLVKANTPASIARARALTGGSMRRLFPLLVEAQTRIAPFLDTARSVDTVLEEKRAGAWSALRFRSIAVFRIPFLGMERIESVQAAHLFQDSSGWKIFEIEELADAAAPLIPRTGIPAMEADTGAAASAATSLLLPVSRRAPSKADMPRVTRLRLRIAMRDGSEPAKILETSVSALPTIAAPAPWADSLAVYRASSDELDLTDKMLRTRAAKLKQGSPNDVETTRRIWIFVSTAFDYKLGATLFGNSREALRGMKGDCSEAAVLTAALLRAAGIPSRVVMGYATLESGVWIGHAWTEAFLTDRWVGVDAALRAFPAGANRLALVTLSGEKPMKPEATNLMLRTLANLDIQIEGAWAGEEVLPLRAHPEAGVQAKQFWEQVLEGMGR
jgi:hypothetical protein